MEVIIVGIVFGLGTMTVLKLAGIITGEMHARREHKLKTKEADIKMLELEKQTPIALESTKEKSIDEILSERFAKGEINEAEYTKIMDTILKHKEN